MRVRREFFSRRIGSGRPAPRGQAEGRPYKGKKTLEVGQVFVEVGYGFYAAVVVLEKDVLVRSMGVFVR